MDGIFNLTAMIKLFDKLNFIQKFYFDWTIDYLIKYTQSRRTVWIRKNLTSVIYSCQYRNISYQIHLWESEETANEIIINFDYGNYRVQVCSNDRDRMGFNKCRELYLVVENTVNPYS